MEAPSWLNNDDAFKAARKRSLPAGVTRSPRRIGAVSKHGVAMIHFCPNNEPVADARAVLKIWYGPETIFLELLREASYYFQKNMGTVLLSDGFGGRWPVHRQVFAGRSVCSVAALPLLCLAVAASVPCYSPLALGWNQAELSALRASSSGVEGARRRPDLAFRLGPSLDHPAMSRCRRRGGGGGGEGGSRRDR